MKQSNIISAYQTLNSFSDNDKLSYEILWDLFQLKSQLKPHVEFYEEQFEKIKQKYLPQADEEGNLTGKPWLEYKAEVESLMNMDKDVQFEKPNLKLKDMPGITLKIMEALQDFVNFSKD